MRRLALLATLSLLATPAPAVERLADVTILDRDSGRVLPTYFHRGEYWVAGTPGARYSISVRNRLGERVLAVMAVDGVNVISGETAGFGQSGYVFDARQCYDITGWRKSNSEVAQFLFSAAPDSYAARTGRAANIGVIGVALFRESVAAPIAMSAPPPAAPAEPLADAARERLAAAAPSASTAPGLAGASGNVARAAPAPSAKLGTGHGEREGSYVVHTQFTRLHDSPDEVIRIRYDSRQNLVAMGVIREPAPLPAGPDAFPASPGPGYVPDPPAYPGVGLR